MKYKTNSETNPVHIWRLSDTIIEKLIRQIQHEIYNHNLYSSFASYYKANGLDKLYTYYTARANEELVHHKWIVDYLNENHVEFKYPSIPEINEEYNDLLTPFE